MLKITIPFYSQIAFSGGVGEMSRLLGRHAGQCGVRIVDLDDRDLSAGIQVRSPSLRLRRIRKLNHVLNLLHFDRRFPPTDIVLFQTSMSRNALARDVAYMRHCQSRSMRYVVYVHGWQHDFIRLLKRTGMHRLVVRSFQKARHVFVLASEFKAELVSWGVPDALISVVHNMVDDELMREANIEWKVESIRNSPLVNILFMGRVVREKGIYELVDAYRELKSRDNDVALTIAGDGPARRDIERYVNRNRVPSVAFLGHVTGSAKARALQDAHILCLPSYSEGMPLAVLEGIAFGCVIVTRPVGGLPDLIDRDMGVLTETLNATELADVLAQMAARENLERIALHNHDFARKSLGSSTACAGLIRTIRSAVE